MKSLCESILGSNSAGINSVFANDIYFQAKIIVKLLQEIFNIEIPEDKIESKEAGASYGFVCYMNEKELEKKLRQLQKELQRYRYYEKTNIRKKPKSNGILLELEPPISEQFLFPEVSIMFNKWESKGDAWIVNILDNRDYDIPFRDYYKK